MTDVARIEVAPPRASEFYARCVGDAAKLIEAAAISGLDKELAMVRVKLEEHARDHPEDLRLILAGAKLVSQMVAQQYRMSPARADELADNLGATIRSITSQLFPEKIDDL